MNTFTYLLGAGASCNVLPLVREFPARLEGFKKYSEANFPISIQENIDLIKKISNPQERFIADLDNLIIEAKNHASIDTYAKKLYLTDAQEELVKLKSLIDLYLSIEQFNNGIDPRYDAFFAALLKEENNSIVLPENIRIISWNYDLQIELSLGSLLQSYNTMQLEERIGIYPPSMRSTHSNYSIIKLNGTAMGWLFENDKFNKRTFDPKKYKAKFLSHDRDEMLKTLILDYFENNYLSNPDQIRIPSILFSWEKDSIAQNARHYALQVMNNTDFLIIIGYSFPTFNRSVDRELLKSLRPLKHIYIQSPEESIEGVEQRLVSLIGMKPQNYHQIPETDEFYIPYEYQ